MKGAHFLAVHALVYHALFRIVATGSSWDKWKKQQQQHFEADCGYGSFFHFVRRLFYSQFNENCCTRYLQSWIWMNLYMDALHFVCALCRHQLTWGIIYMKTLTCWAPNWTFLISTFFFFMSLFARERRNRKQDWKLISHLGSGVRRKWGLLNGIALFVALYAICFWCLCILAPEIHLGNCFPFRCFFLCIEFFIRNFVGVNRWGRRTWPCFLFVNMYASGRRINLMLMDFHLFCSREVSSHPHTIHAHFVCACASFCV